MDLEAALQKAVDRPTEQKRRVAKAKPKETKRHPVEASTAPKRGRGGHFEATNAWSKRITLDVTPEQNKFLAAFSVEHETKKNPILRELIDLLKEDSALAQRVLDRLNK